MSARSFVIHHAFSDTRLLLAALADSCARALSLSQASLGKSQRKYVSNIQRGVGGDSPTSLGNGVDANGFGNSHPLRSTSRSRTGGRSGSSSRAPSRGRSGHGAVGHRLPAEKVNHHPLIDQGVRSVSRGRGGVGGGRGAEGGNGHSHTAAGNGNGDTLSKLQRKKLQEEEDQAALSRDQAWAERGEEEDGALLLDGHTRAKLRVTTPHPDCTFTPSIKTLPKFEPQVSTGDPHP
eukprot:COSAG05_NODE_130_length_17165_cov_154.623638_20_plen_235_part_00